MSKRIDLKVISMGGALGAGDVQSGLSEAAIGYEATDQCVEQNQRIVRNGTVYNLGQKERRREGVDRIAKIKAELGEGKITGIDDRVVYRFFKRAFDVAFSASVLILLSWLFLLIALLIKLDDPKGPVFFKQTRVGKNGQTFQMLKFRSMCVDAEAKLAQLRDLNEKSGPVFKIADDPRITSVGKYLRKLSLDELPQFLNVFFGDMSTVGPRPALPTEVATYNDYQRQRLTVKPGLTCYWQTRRNRDSITFDEWVDLDLLYIKKCSIWNDFKLIIQTVGVVLTAQGN